ncbi:MAG: hypothetical protein IH886_16710 [Nitrospinae bacterium]|nr:hypothetical protein [Nitrospinota bacterium]
MTEFVFSGLPDLVRPSRPNKNANFLPLGKRLKKHVLPEVSRQGRGRNRHAFPALEWQLLYLD